MARPRLLLVLLLMMAVRDTVDGTRESNHRFKMMNKRQSSAVVLLEEDHNAMCRLPDGSYLPVDLVSLIHRVTL